jgi:hypothetical protein
LETSEVRKPALSKTRSVVTLLGSVVRLMRLRASRVNEVVPVP